MASRDFDRGMIAWFIRNPVAANIIMVLIVAGGIMTARGLARESFPSIPPNRVTIEVSFPSGSPQRAEEGIVIKIEEALQGAPGIKRVSSSSRTDGVTVVVEKTTDADIDLLLTEVKTRVDAIPNLPERAERPVISKQGSDYHAIWVQVSGRVDEQTLNAVSQALRRDLLLSSAIRRIESAGNQKPEIHIEVDDGTLEAYGMTLAGLVEILGEESFTDLSGRLHSERGTISLRADRQAYWKQDFANTPLRIGVDGTVLRLGDVARVQDTFSDASRSWMRFDGRPSIGLQVFKDAGISSELVRQAVETTLDRWRHQGRLPAGVAIETWHDSSREVAQRISLMARNAALGVVLVFAILAVTLDLRVAFWVAMGLPVAFGGAFLMMGRQFFDLSLNDLTTFGMIVALGIVVDDAVVIGESIHAAKRRCKNPLAGTLEGVHQVAVPTVFGVLTTIIAFSLMPLVRGELGKIFAQFAVVAASCLAFSLVESKLILPAHLRNLDPSSPGSALAAKWRRVQHVADRGFMWLSERYAVVIDRVLARPGISLLWGAAFSAAVLSLLLTGAVRSVFFPEIPGDVISASLTMEESAGSALTEEALRHLEASLLDATRALTPPEASAAETVGTGIGALQVHMSSDRVAAITAELAPRSERLWGAKALTDRWRHLSGRPEGVQALAFSATLDAFAAISLEVEAGTEATLHAAHGALIAELHRLDAVRDVRDNLSPGRSEIRLTLTPEGRSRGLSAADLSGQVQQAFLGYEVQRIQRGHDEVRLRVRYPPERRRDVSDLEQLRLRTPQGEPVPLSVVAGLERTTAVSEITHVDGRRVSTITADVDRDRRSPEEVLSEIEETIVPRLQATFPDLRVTQSGEATEFAESRASLFTILLLVLAAIYALLAIPLNSYLQPLLVMAVIPFGLLGAIVGHWIHDLPMSLLSIFGLLALSGVVVNDSLLLVSAFNTRRAAGESPRVAIAAAGASRLRAVLLTSVTTFAGLAPLVRETSEQAQYLIPAAVSLAYGVLFATAITLILVPLLLFLTTKIPRRRSEGAAPKV